MRRDAGQIPVVPGREGIAIDTGQFAIRVPTDAEAVSIDFKRGFYAFLDWRSMNAWP